MLDQLVSTFALFGLEVNVKKTKMMSSTVTTNDVVLVDTAAGPLELLPADSIHKYLGRAWSGDFAKRATTATRHRLGCAWGKFGSLDKTLLNHWVNLHSRLKLFDACITPALLYSLETCPLTQGLLSKIEATQRKMLRRMIGF